MGEEFPISQRICKTDLRSSTSPSVYLQILGTIAVSDQCTTVGPILTSPIISFPPGGLSTWKPPPPGPFVPNFAIGAVWIDPPIEVTGILAPLTINDLACPTWGLGRSTQADGKVVTTIGPPWSPVIAPPVEAFSLDSTWASLCTGMLTHSLITETLGWNLAPIALNARGGLGLVPAPVIPIGTPTSVPAPNHADPTTVPNEQLAPSTVAARPSYSPLGPADPPARTGDPIGDSPNPSLAIAPANPARPGSPPGGPIAAPTNKNDPPAYPTLSQPIAPTASAVGAKDPQAGPVVPISDALDPPQQGDSQPQTQGLGAIIYNAFGKSGPDIGGVENGVNTIIVPTAGVQEVNIGGGQVLSVDPSGVQFEGKIYSVGGPAMTVSNSVYTLVPQHDSENSNKKDDSSPIDSPPPAPDTLTIAGHTVVPNPAGMDVAGSSIFPGGSAVTISNTPVFLDPSGILVVGSSSFSLSPQSVFTIGNQLFTANPTGFILNGATISPGGAAQTLDGTVVSLGQSGALAIGSSTISLPTPSFTPSAISTFSIDGQTFTPNPTAFSIAGTTISAGGPAVTVDGTIVSLQPSGTLIVGSNTIPLSTPSILPDGNVLSIAGQTFTPNPSAFSIAGTTISAGGPAVTVAGTIISLRPSGTLILGSSTIPLSTLPSSPLNINGLSVVAQSSLAIVDGVTISPGAAAVTIDGSVVSLEAGGATLDVGTGRFAMPTGAANGSGGSVDFLGGQGKGVEVSSTLMLLFSVGGSLMLMA